MNRIYPLLLSVIISFACFWASAKTKVVRVYMVGGNVYTEKVSDIDSISVTSPMFLSGSVKDTPVAETTDKCALFSAASENLLNLLDADMNKIESFSLDKRCEIYFYEDEISILPEGAEFATNVPYDDFRLMTFSSDGSGISEVSVDEKSDINIVYDRMSETLAVTASNAISDIQIYDMRGVCLRRLSPAKESVSVSAGDIPSGIYVIKVVTGNNVYTRKIAKH